MIDNIGYVLKPININKPSAPSFCGTFEFELGKDYKSLTDVFEKTTDDVFVKISDDEVTRCNFFIQKLNEFALKTMPENHNLKILIDKDNNKSGFTYFPQRVTISYGVQDNKQHHESVIYRKSLRNFINTPLLSLRNFISTLLLLLRRKKTENKQTLINEKDCNNFIKSTIKPVMDKELGGKGRNSTLNAMGALITKKLSQ